MSRPGYASPSNAPRPKPGEPDALAIQQQGAVERAAARRGVRDAAIVAVLLYAGARVEECGPLELDDIAITARTGTSACTAREMRSAPFPSPRLPVPASLPGWTSAAASRVRHHPGRPSHRCGRRHHRPAPAPASPHLRHPTPAGGADPPGPSPPRPRLPGHLGPLLPSQTRRNRRRRRTRLQPVSTPRPTLRLGSRARRRPDDGPLADMSFARWWSWGLPDTYWSFPGGALPGLAGQCQLLPASREGDG